MCNFLNCSEVEINEPMFEKKWKGYREHKFSKLFLRRLRTNSVFQTKLLKFLAKGQCTVLYELHVLFIKWFELVGEIELFRTANVIDLLLQENSASYCEKSHYFQKYGV